MVLVYVCRRACAYVCVRTCVSVCICVCSQSRMCFLKRTRQTRNLVTICYFILFNNKFRSYSSNIRPTFVEDFPLYTKFELELRLCFFYALTATKTRIKMFVENKTRVEGEQTNEHYIEFNKRTNKQCMRTHRQANKQTTEVPHNY